MKVLGRVLAALWAKFVDLLQTEPAVIYGGVLEAAAYITTQILHRSFTQHEQDAIKGALAALPVVLALIVRAQVTPQARIETVVSKILDANKPAAPVEGPPTGA